MNCDEAWWLTYSCVIEDVRTRIVDFVRRNKDVSRADLFRVAFLDCNEGRVDVGSLQGGHMGSAFSHAIENESMQET